MFNFLVLFIFSFNFSWCPNFKLDCIRNFENTNFVLKVEESSTFEKREIESWEKIGGFFSPKYCDKSFVKLLDLGCNLITKQDLQELMLKTLVVRANNGCKNSIKVLLHTQEYFGLKIEYDRSTIQFFGPELIDLQYDERIIQVDNYLSQGDQIDVPMLSYDGYYYFVSFFEKGKYDPSFIRNFYSLPDCIQLLLHAGRGQFKKYFIRKYNVVFEQLNENLLYNGQKISSRSKFSVSAISAQVEAAVSNIRKWMSGTRIKIKVDD